MCKKCNSDTYRKFGKISLQVFSLSGWCRKKIQRYCCNTCRHIWHNAILFGMFTVEIIEWATYTYIRSMSLENTRDIIQSLYEVEVLPKNILLKHIETLIDKIPSFYTITKHLQPYRSGYYAWDGTWFKFKGKNKVLLICFDVNTLDIVGYHVANDETYETYLELAHKIEEHEPNILARSKGFFSDGDIGLLKLFKQNYGKVPVQLCAFHKYSRVGQIVPFVRPKEIDKKLKEMTEAVIFASTKQKAQYALLTLKRYAQTHQKNAKVKKVIGVLKRNFDLLLTHYDHPEMSPYNNVLEGFNHIIKRKLRLMKGFKKEQNIDRWLKLILLEYRFHEIRSSKFKSRNGKSPLQLAKVELPKMYNWIKYIRKNIGWCN